MFQILSSGLYSDKIGAVIREISANAMDAHTMAGCPQKPFEVKLPTALDPSFYVKDWGPGLDAGEVTELYTTYGWSSKQDHAEATGAFGLGSKSPFAYADQFSVVAVKDGVKRIFTAHKVNMEPKITLMSEGPADADWPHGVMVTLPVKVADISEMYHKAARILRWFHVRPDVIGADDDFFNEVDPRFSVCNKDFAFGAKRDLDQIPRVVMANVAYPLDPSKLGELSAAQAVLFAAGMGTHLFLPNGAILPTPSRETLQYEKDSIERVRQALSAAVLTVAKTLVALIRSEQPSEFMKHRKIQEQVKEYPSALRANISPILETVIHDPEELRQACRLVQNAYREVPGWVGDGAVPARPSGSSFSTGPVQVQESTEDARVYRITSGDRGAHVCREIVHGMIKRGQKEEQAMLPYLGNYFVCYAEGPNARDKAKELVDNGVTVLFVDPVQRSSVDYARQVALRICGNGLLGGLCAPISTATLPTPKAALSRRKPNKEAPPNPRSAFSTDQVSLGYVHSANRSSLVSSLHDTEIDWGSAPQDVMCYVIEVTAPGSHNRKFQDGTGKVWDERDFARYVHAYSCLAKALGPLFKGPTRFLVIPRRQAKAYCLPQNGFELFTKAAANALSTQEVRDYLKEHASVMPVVSLNSSLSANAPYGCLVQSRLGLISANLWKSFERICTDPDILRTTEVLASLARENHLTPEQKKGIELRHLVTTFLGRAPAEHKPDWDHLRFENLHTLCYAVCDRYPMLNGIDWDWVQRHASTPESAELIRLACGWAQVPASEVTAEEEGPNTRLAA